MRKIDSLFNSLLGKNAVAPNTSSKLLQSLDF
jgi:hypothetical protein